jgi:outer membrane protein TolC
MPTWRTAIAAVCMGVVAAAQNAPQQMNLQQAVDAAVRNYPSIRVSSEQMEAAAAAIELARTAYLPRADVLAQVNRATRNNIFGLLLPQSVISPISGPVLNTNNLTNVWGSAVGFLVSWEPFDFGLRRANVETAEASRKRAEAGVQRSRFEVAALAADAYLTLVAANETAAASRAQVERARTVGTIVEALVKSELRPGADASRSHADIAVAETQVVRAEEAIRLAQANLKQFTGVEVAPVNPTTQPPESMQPGQTVADHPAAKEQQAVIAEVEAREHALERSYYPHFNLQGTSYARGSGANVDGTTGGAFSGFGPNIQNWAVGMTVTFPAMDFASIRARREIEKHNRLSESARYQQILAELNARLDRANANLIAAHRIAAQLPAQLEAAEASERQAAARYRAGLSTLVEVADAQRLLTDTQIESALARLNIWRAQLGVMVAQGDVSPFLEQVK